jgi:hypothetical protein
LESYYLNMVSSLGLDKYLKGYNKFKQNLENLKELASNWEFNVDIIDDDGLTPLHYSCQYNKPQCAKILLLESGASIDLSCEAGFRPRELLQNSEVKQIFIEFYEKVDNAIKENK